MTATDLPVCHVQYPKCGACGNDTEYDSEGLVCWGCGLSYGDGEDFTRAEFLDEEAETCAVPCLNSWHGGYDCNPCALPKGHESMHWTNCQPIRLDVTP